MEIFNTIENLRHWLDSRTGIIGFVPTMGALHDGHRSLVERCRKECDTVVVSVFVNPTQFNDKNDLHNYPRTPEADARLLEAAGADAVLMPSVDEIYPEPDTRKFDFGALEQVMEGALRPGHFNGVGQVVSRLFDIVRPNRAYFGEKDFQQLAIIRRMVQQLNLNLEIVGCPIKRGDDGLALSSRNVLLNPAQRAEAPQIYAVMSAVAQDCRTLTVDETIRRVTEAINRNPQLDVEYFQLVDNDTLQPVGSWNDSPHIRGCIAVRVGNIRLIDNMQFK